MTIHQSQFPSREPIHAGVRIEITRPSPAPILFTITDDDIVDLRTGKVDPVLTAQYAKGLAPVPTEPEIDPAFFAATRESQGQPVDAVPPSTDVGRQFNSAFLAVEGRSIDDWAAGLRRPRKRRAAA